MQGTTTIPGISIIMATYNRARYILATIQSIRDQTYTHWELIIIDDGSDDNTEELIIGLYDERIRFYKAGRSGITGKLKNIGLEKAQGELVAFMDSDDLWDPTKLEKQVKALQQYPEAGFSLAGGYNFRELGKPIEYFYKQREGTRFDNIFISLFRSEVAILFPTLIVRRECLADVGRFKETKSFSDTDFILQLASHFKAVVLYEPLLFRRLHGSNDSGSNWEPRYYEWIEVIQQNAGKGKLPLKIARDSLFKLYISFGEKCLLHKQRGKAIGKFMNAWKNKPLSIVPLKKTGKAMLRWLINK